MRAPGGRSLVFAEWGDLDGSPVFALHGTPGGRRGRAGACPGVSPHRPARSIRAQ
jgi:hypothetical protein